MDRDEARAELWRRYDAGTMPARELEVRLQRLDRAADGDAAAVQAAVAGPLPLHRRRSLRLAAAGVAAVAVLAAGAAGAMTLLDGDDGGGGSGGGSGGGAGGFEPPRAGGAPVPRPAPIEDGGAVATTVVVAEPVGRADCSLPDSPESWEEPAANPALLSDPPYVPEGYELAEELVIEPGTDPDSNMGIAAGNPAPEEILGRSLDGDLRVELRAFRYADTLSATESGQSAASTACANAEHFDVPDQPDLYGTLVTGVIPDTAFVSFQLAERRFIVSVEAEGDVDEAIALAGEIAAAELEAARTAP